MRDDILNVLTNSDRALDIYELQDYLGIDTVEGTQALLEELQKMEDEVLIYHSNKDKYMLLKNSHLRKGIMRANKKGYGFVEIEDLKEDEIPCTENLLDTVKRVIDYWNSDIEKDLLKKIGFFIVSNFHY